VNKHVTNITLFFSVFVLFDHHLQDAFLALSSQNYQPRPLPPKVMTSLMDEQFTMSSLNLKHCMFDNLKGIDCQDTLTNININYELG